MHHIASRKSSGRQRPNAGRLKTARKRRVCRRVLPKDCFRAGWPRRCRRRLSEIGRFLRCRRSARWGVCGSRLTKARRKRSRKRPVGWPGSRPNLRASRPGRLASTGCRVSANGIPVGGMAGAGFRGWAVAAVVFVGRVIRPTSGGMNRPWHQLPAMSSIALASEVSSSVNPPASWVVSVTDTLL